MVFDGDIPENERKDVCDAERTYKDWGNNSYSFVLPIPDHRQSLKGVCIELYYTDDDLMGYYVDGRRLYLAWEFHPESAQHRKDLTITSLSVNNIRGKITPHP